jgi:3'-5' exoribonuclease
MSRAKPTLAALSEMTPGQFADCFALLAERAKNATRDGKPFYACRFRDARRAVSVMVWSDGPHYEDCEKNWQVGQCYKLRGLYGEHEKYGPQFELQQIRAVNDADRADGFDPLDLVERSRRDPGAMFAELRGAAEHEITDEPLLRLVVLLLDRHAATLRWLPGSKRHYYPFAGGWLEHTLAVTQSCLLLADKYRAHYDDLKPPLNRDLLVAGAILHDIGRAVELDNPFAIQQTISGRLLGHLFLGRDLVRDAARDVPDLNPELLQLLEHLIVSHLNLPEWGSPRLPLIPESLILHHADDLDAKLEMYARCLRTDTATGPFTDRDPVLGKQLYKGREV